MATKDDANDERHIVNKIIIWIAHTCGVSGLIVIFAIFQIGRLSTSMSAGPHTELTADLTVVALWVWLKWLSPLYHIWIWEPIKAKLPAGIF